LGIVLPTFAGAYLVIAYRYFSGKDLSAQEADQARQMIEKRLAHNDAGTAAERKFAAAVLLLHDSSTCPSLINSDYRGWWWYANDIGKPQSFDDERVDLDYQRILKNPLFMTAADKATASAELAKLNNAPAAPAYLTAIAIDWAKSHPQDPRVPETLHLAVRCTRLGARDGNSSKLSKEAFLILHHKYARSSWTEATPYYY
jgi:hypothetical protein